MDRRMIVVPIAILLLTIWGAALAADCGEPVPAPKFQVGEKWTWRNGKGVESTDEVVQVEGDFIQIKWSNGDLASYDKDRILRKVVRKSGEVITQQGAGAYTTVGQKVLDFPLQVGKKWDYTYTAQPSSGLGTFQTYYQQYKIVACEDVTTPAGRFPAFKVEVVQGVNRSPSHNYPNNGTFYSWYAPPVKTSVRRQYVPSLWWSNPVDNELIKFEVK